MKSCTEPQLSGNPVAARGECGVKYRAAFAENQDIAPAVLRPTCAR